MEPQIDAPLVIPATAETLPLAELMALAEVTEADVMSAIEVWKESAPVEYQQILNAEPE